MWGTGRGASSWQPIALDGLGPVKAFGLAEARERNRRVSQQLADEVDPLLAKRAAKAAQAATAATRLTFREVAERFVARRDASWSSAQHAAEYTSSLQRFTFPIIGSMDVAEIGVPHVLAVLEQKVTAVKNLPAGSLFGRRAPWRRPTGLGIRVESVLDYAGSARPRQRDANRRARQFGVRAAVAGEGEAQGASRGRAPMPKSRR